MFVFEFDGVGNRASVPDISDRGFRLLEGLELPDRYAVRRPIATGGMASVWCARDRMLGRSVAIKLISERFARDESALRRFKQEARAAARLSGHRHVVTIYDIGQAIDRDAPLGRPFIVMEYLTGGTVADALRVGEVTHEQAVKWVRQAAAALDYAHSRGVIHRDIKPVNLLLDGERTLHVADFGIAQLASEETFSGSGQMLGTAAYIAPEQVLGRPATEASDRYALAVAAFELLAGQRPFGGEHFAGQTRQHLDSEPPTASQIDPTLPTALDRVLQRGMAKRPEERWPSAGEFAGAVESALGAADAQTARVIRRPVVAPPPRHVGSNRRAAAPARLATAHPRRGRGRGMALAALAAVALGVGVAAADSGMFAGSSRPTGSTHSTQTLSAARPRPPATHARVARHHATRPPATTTVQASPVAATTPPPTAETLQARGHELVQDGNPAAAIPVLRQALGAASPPSLTYAYALFDLGRALLLAGDTKAAVEVLWQRMQIPNQTGVVRAELQQALRALGQQASGGGAPAPPAGPAGGQLKHHGHGHAFGHGGPGPFG
jgi:eukaryotic-like serine/threonine-protein kinase